MIGAVRSIMLVPNANRKKSASFVISQGIWRSNVLSFPQKRKIPFPSRSVEMAKKGPLSLQLRMRKFQSKSQLPKIGLKNKGLGSKRDGTRMMMMITHIVKSVGVRSM